jgi:hypothetical protein
MPTFRAHLLLGPLETIGRAPQVVTTVFADAVVGPVPPALPQQVQPHSVSDYSQERQP